MELIKVSFKDSCYETPTLIVPKEVFPLIHNIKSGSSRVPIKLPIYEITSPGEGPEPTGQFYEHNTIKRTVYTDEAASALAQAEALLMEAIERLEEVKYSFTVKGFNCIDSRCYCCGKYQYAEIVKAFISKCLVKLPEMI